MAHREEIKDRLALVRGYRDHDPHVIFDNSSTHTTPTVQAWLAAIAECTLISP